MTAGGRSTCHGLTLLEIGAVLVVLTLTFSIVAPSLAPLADDAALRAASSGMLDLDVRARLAARRSGALELRIENRPGEGVTSIRAVSTARGTGPETLFEHALPRGVHALWEQGGEPVESVRFDRAGRTAPYLVTVYNSQRATAYEISGRTGWATPAEEIPQ